MVLIYSHISSPRLQYILDFIFVGLLRTVYRITIDSEEYRQYEGVRVNYSDTAMCSTEIHIRNHSLLFENDIRHQAIACSASNGKPVFFTHHNDDLGFDILAASFYLLTRYEEYLPHTKDLYGRFAHEQSLAYKEQFLQLPLINVWTKEFGESIQKMFPQFILEEKPFKFLPTYDIDIAYSYRHKGLIRNLGGAIKSPSIERLKVLCRLKQDPFDAYAWLHSMHHRYQLQPIYFFLVSEKNSGLDKNILPHKTALWNLVKEHAKKYKTGIHPSWQSGDRPALLKSEKQQLESMGEITITDSRQHYIRFNLPEGYRRLIAAGITDDYSMGYGSINGFRASVASTFYWYDLEKNEPTELKIHPFCFMDANSFYEQHQTSEQAFNELMQLYTACKTVNGTLITIWHNNFLGTDKTFKGWREMYEQFIKKFAL